MALVPQRDQGIQISIQPLKETEDHLTKETKSQLSIGEINLEWLPEVFNLIEVNDDSYIRGYVRSEEEANLVLQAHAKNTESLFSLSKDDGPVKQKGSRRLFCYSKLLDLASHVTSSIRCKRYICNFGTKYTPQRKSHHDNIGGKVQKVYYTTKTGCPANICVTEVAVYTDYSLDGLTVKERRTMLNSLKEALAQNPQDINVEEYFHLKLPLKSTHRGHDVNEHAWKVRKTHPNILKKIEELACMGIRKMAVLKPILNAYAEDSLIEGNAEEVRHLPYYFPSTKTIKNKLAHATRKHNLSKICVSKAKSGTKLKKRNRKVQDNVQL